MVSGYPDLLTSVNFHPLIIADIDVGHGAKKNNLGIR